MDTQVTPKRSFWRSRKFLYGVVIFLFVGSLGTLLDVSDPQPTSTPEVSQPTVAEADTVPQDPSKEEAQKELEEVMGLAKQARLITSYEFNEMGNTVYADVTWYTQTVAFKKDFMAKVAMLKKTITGYHRFEVRDAYSNEKVGEVTAFSGSVEVYK